MKTSACGAKYKFTLASVTIILAGVVGFTPILSVPDIKIHPLYIVETYFNTNNTKKQVAVGSSHKLTRIGVSLAKYITTQPGWFFFFFFFFFLPPSSWVSGKDDLASF